MSKLVAFLILGAVLAADATPGILVHQSIPDGQMFLQLNAKLGKIVESPMENDQHAFSEYGINFRYESNTTVGGRYSWLPSMTVGYNWNDRLAFWGMIELGKLKTTSERDWVLSADSNVFLGYNTYNTGCILNLSNVDYTGYFLGLQYSFMPKNKYVGPYAKAGFGVNRVEYGYMFTNNQPFSYDTGITYSRPATVLYKETQVSVEADEFLLGGYFGLGTDILIFRFLKLNLEAAFNVSQEANSSPEDYYTLLSKNDFSPYKFNDGTFSLSNYSVRMGLKFLMF